MSQITAISSGGGGSGIITIDGDTGSVTGSTVTLTGGTSGMKFSGSGTTLTASPPSAAVNFLVYQSGNVVNVTGDNTRYVCVFDGVSYNVGSGFDTVGKTTFTAPISGIYQFTGCVYGAVYGVGHTQQDIEVVTSNFDTLVSSVNPFVTSVNRSGTQYLSINWSACVELTASQSVFVVFTVYNSTKTVDFIGGTGPLTSWFSGCLL